MPLSSEYLGGLEYQAFSTTRNFAGSQSTFAESGLEQSKIGIRVSEPIIDDFTLIARTDTGFNPLSGQLVDACKALASNSSKPQGEQTANADSSRCGQAFNGVIWAGFNSPRFGALTIGRQQSLQLNPLPTPGLAAYISDDKSYNLMGKYVFELGNKDKLTAAYLGYSHIEKAHADYNVGSAQNNYPISVGININNTAKYDMEWVGARYAMSSGWNFTGAYYHITQNNWTIGLGPSGNDNLGCVAAGLLCSGEFEEVSAVADYIINKHYDVYGGVNWSEVTNGLANGFPGTTVGTTGAQVQTTVTWGFRIRI